MPFNKSIHEQMTKIDYPIKQIEAFDVTYQGFDETPLKGFYIRPTQFEGFTLGNILTNGEIPLYAGMALVNVQEPSLQRIFSYINACFFFYFSNHAL